MSKRIISFSLWGEGTHLKWAFLNISEARIIYPNWICRFYVAPEISKELRSLLENEGAEVVPYIPEFGDWEGLFLRFYPIIDNDVEYFVSRDADSLVNWREKAAVDEWIESGKDFHIMRDNWQHNVRILGGMWGAKGGIFPILKYDVENWIYMTRNGIVKKGDDQIYLNERLWPFIQFNHIAHDSAFGKNYDVSGSVKPFPNHKPNHKYAPHIGAIIDEHL